MTTLHPSLIATEPTVIAVALSPRSWRSALQRHCRDHVADVIVLPVRDGRDGLERSPQLFIVDDDTSWLSAPFVVQARESGTVVVGLYDPLEADGHGQAHLKRLGVEHVAPSSLSTEELIDIVRRARPVDDVNDRFAAQVVDLDERTPTELRRIVAVGGPAGAGATEVSVGIASCWSSNALLIDVDETHPTLARRLGLGIHPHLISAIDAHRGEQMSLSADPVALEECLARTALGGSRLSFDVVVGLAARDDWSLVKAQDVADLLVELAARWDVVIARVGPQLEDLSRHVDRFGQSRLTVAKADRVVGVCDATSTGLLRFVDWLVDLLPLVGETPVDVVLNRAPRSLSARTQLESQLREIAGPRIGSIVPVRHDRRVERAAWDAGLVRHGRFARSMNRLTRSIEESMIEALPTSAMAEVEENS